MAIIEVKDGNLVGAVQELFRTMLTRGALSAILVPQEIPSRKTVIQTLVRDPDKLATANPLAPVFGINSARIIAKMCAGPLDRSPAGLAAEEQAEEQDQQQEGNDEPENASTEDQAPAENGQQTSEEGRDDPEKQPSAETPGAPAEGPAEAEEQPADAPIGVVLRPCEIRALVELVKLQQASMEQFLVIGVDCWGAYSVQDYAAKVAQGSENSSVTADFLRQVTAGQIPEDLRSACRACQYPSPTFADVVIQLVGEDIGRQIRLQACTEKGQRLLEALELTATPDSDEREAALGKLRDAKKELAREDPTEFLETIASLCINCHNCRAVCPICYCKQCVFDGEVFQYPMEKYLNWSGKKGVLNMPPDKLLFHLTRMSHVATSCVACGQCEAGCPSGIPLGEMYRKVSAAVQQALGYEAGRSVDDELPLTTFREDELSVVEN